MGKTIDYVVESARKGYKLIKKSAVSLYIDLLKVSVLSTVISLGGLVLIGLVLFAFFGTDVGEALMGVATPESGTMLVVFLLIAILIYVVFLFLSNAVASVSYNVIENRASGKGTSIIAHAKENLMPVVRYTIVFWAVLLVVALPILLSLLLGGIGAVVGMCFFSALALMIYVLFPFFIQFGMFELILGKKGAIDSMKSSSRLVKANILPVILLDIILVVIIFAVGAGLSLFSSILEFIIAAFSLAGTGGMLLGFAIYVVLYMAVSILISTASATIIFPLVYYFWKGLGR